MLPSSLFFFFFFFFFDFLGYGYDICFVLFFCLTRHEFFFLGHDFYFLINWVITFFLGHFFVLIDHHFLTRVYK